MGRPRGRPRRRDRRRRGPGAALRADDARPRHPRPRPRVLRRCSPAGARMAGRGGAARHVCHRRRPGNRPAGGYREGRHMSACVRRPRPPAAPASRPYPSRCRTAAAGAGRDGRVGRPRVRAATGRRRRARGRPRPAPRRRGAVARRHHPPARASVGIDVTVVTVFTADQEPGTPLSPLAEANHRAWGIGDAPFEERRHEDIRAASVGGSAAAPSTWGSSTPSTAGAPTATLLCRRRCRRRCPPRRRRHDDQPDRGRAAGHARRLGGARVFCPLSAATHVDHMLVRAAAESIVGAGAMTYYEEFPYVWWAFRVATPPPTLRHAAVDRPLGEDDVQRRIDAICCYPSQLAGLFPSRERHRPPGHR